MTRREVDRRRRQLGMLRFGLLFTAVALLVGSTNQPAVGRPQAAPAQRALAFTPIGDPETHGGHDHDGQDDPMPEGDAGPDGNSQDEQPGEDQGGEPGQGDQPEGSDPGGDGQDNPGAGQGDGSGDPDEQGADQGQDQTGGSGDDGDGQDGGTEGQGEQAVEGCDPERLPLHDGAQEGLRCVPTAIGEVPDPAEIPRVRLVNPTPGETLEPGESFVVEAVVQDMVTGSFANPDEDYFQFSQRLTDQGLVIGHAHIAIQPLDQDEGVPEAQDLAFFQGINEPAEDGRFQVEVDDGLEEPGNYRILIFTSSTGHQPVVSPVARHFAPVDVIRVQVADDGEDAPTAGQGDLGQDGSDENSLLEEAVQVQAGTGAAVATGDPGDGVPPPPVGGGEAGDGGTGDHNSLPPSSTDSPGNQAPPDPAVPVTAENADSEALPSSGLSANVLLVGAGILVAVGVILVALARRRRHRAHAYQGRHLRPRLPSGDEAWSSSLTELLPEEPEQPDRQRGGS